MKSAFVRSSKRTPCPICGRTKDADCSWTTDLILCHQSDSSQSAASMRIGDTVKVDNRDWALIRLNAGFSGKAAVFRPHQSGEKSVLTYQQMQSVAVVEAVSEAESIEEQMKRLIRSIDKTLSMPCVEFMLDSDIKIERDLAEVAYEESKGLLKSLTRLSRTDSYFAALLEEFEVKMRQLKYQLDDLTLYCENPGKYCENFLI